MLNSPPKHKKLIHSHRNATTPVEGEAHQMVNHNADVEQPPNNKHELKKIKKPKNRKTNKNKNRTKSKLIGLCCRGTRKSTCTLASITSHFDQILQRSFCFWPLASFQTWILAKSWKWAIPQSGLSQILSTGR